MCVYVVEREELLLWLTLGHCLSPTTPHYLPTHVLHCELLLQEFSQFWGDDC